MLEFGVFTLISAYRVIYPMLSVNVCLRKHTGINLLKTEVHLNLQTYDVHSQPHSEHSSCPLQGQLMLSGKY